MRTAFKCRAYPTPGQAANLARTFGCVRKVWNQTLAWRHGRYHLDGLNTNVPEANAHLTAMKRLPEFAYLSEVSSVPVAAGAADPAEGVRELLRQAGPLPEVQVPDRPSVGRVHPVGVPVA